jgi:hypothetical protein
MMRYVIHMPAQFGIMRHGVRNLELVAIQRERPRLPMPIWIPRDSRLGDPFVAFDAIRPGVSDESARQIRARSVGFSPIGEVSDASFEAFNRDGGGSAKRLLLRKLTVAFGSAD